MTYKIHTLSARAIIGFAEPDGDLFSFRLGKSATGRCVLRGAANTQDDCALFYQIRCVLNGGSFPTETGRGPAVVPDLADVIFYVDFDRIFSAASSPRTEERARKAESMFRFAYRVFSATIVITFLSAAGLDLYFGFC